MASPISISDNHGPFTATIVGFTAAGKPAPVPAGVAIWAVDSATVLTSTPSADGLSTVLTLTKMDGVATLSVSVLSGGSNLSDTAAITVNPTLSSIQIQFSGV